MSWKRFVISKWKRLKIDVTFSTSNLSIINRTWVGVKLDQKMSFTTNWCKFYRACRKEWVWWVVTLCRTDKLQAFSIDQGHHTIEDSLQEEDKIKLCDSNLFHHLQVSLRLIRMLINKLFILQKLLLLLKFRDPKVCNNLLNHHSPLIKNSTRRPWN